MQAKLFPPNGYDRQRSDHLAAFISHVWDYYKQHKREMLWRSDTSPYNVFVSEVMLQQTQVPRVSEKFPAFLKRFPTFGDLAEASFSDVISEWTGLGYNRRAKFLHRSAGIIVNTYDGVLPKDPQDLIALPGIGPNTAGSIAAFAYNFPVVFIETNIRRVMLSAFFATREEPVPDSEILPIVEATLSQENPREWYWALMDLGVALGKSGYNANTKSAHYTRQATFHQSDRQLRGKIVRLLTERGNLVAEEIPRYTGFSADRVATVLERLVREKIIAQTDDEHPTISIAD